MKKIRTGPPMMSFHFTGMRMAGMLAGFAAVSGLVAVAADWPMQSGNSQRNGWARSERILNKGNINSLSVLYRYQANRGAPGLNSLTPPIINGNLITYRGFKEMLLFGASSDQVFSVDADLNRLLWESNLANRGAKPRSVAATVACPGGLTAPVIMAGSSSSSMRFISAASRSPAGPGVRPTRPSPYFPPLSQSVYPLLPATLTQLAALYAVSSDGDLHILNSSTGQDLIPALRFLPPTARVTSLNLRDNVVYATTADHCDGYLNGLYAIDLLSKDKTVASFMPPSGQFAGSGGTAIGADGTVYVQAMYSPGGGRGHSQDSVVALAPKTLQVKDYFTPEGKSPSEKGSAASGITPMVFSWNGKDLIVAGGKNGRLYLLDSKSLGGADHHTPLFQTSAIARVSSKYNGDGFRGTFSSWQDVDTQTRWIYVPVSGPLASSAGFPTGAAGRSNGSIVSFKLDGQTAQPALQPLWASRDLISPAPAVIANGMVFALSTGESPRLAKKNGKPYSVAEWQENAQQATVYAFDAVSGKQLYSSGEAIPGHPRATALAVANGRVYFSTHDNAVYCLGLLRTQPQLAEQ